MKNKLVVMGILAAVSTASAASIAVPDGNFQGVSATVNGPFLIGSSSGAIGTWKGEISCLVSVGGEIQSGLASTLGGPSQPAGTYELKVALPVSAATTVSLSQVLATQFQPNYTYTLTAELYSDTTASLAGSTTLSLKAGTTNLASASGSTLVSVLNSGSGFQTATVTCKTGNTAPAVGIGLSLVSSGVGSAGDLYANNFTLTGTPIQVQLNPVTMPSASRTNFVFSGSGGAPNATYEILATTNLITPESTWQTIVTSQFDTNGNFSQNIPVDPQIPCRFFRLYVP